MSLAGRLQFVELLVLLDELSELPNFLVLVFIKVKPIFLSEPELEQVVIQAFL